MTVASQSCHKLNYISIKKNSVNLSILSAVTSTRYNNKFMTKKPACLKNFNKKIYLYNKIMTKKLECVKNL